MKAKTIYLAVEVRSKTDTEAITKTIGLMKALHDQVVIENFEVFTVDSRPLKETKPYITAILYEIMKVSNFTDDIMEKMKPFMEFVKSVLK